MWDVNQHVDFFPYSVDVCLNVTVDHSQNLKFCYIYVTDFDRDQRSFGVTRGQWVQIMSAPVSQKDKLGVVPYFACLSLIVVQCSEFKREDIAVR